MNGDDPVTEIRRHTIFGENYQLYFKRIEMQGFKSFADPVSIELNEGITCIIGPNGSGKSNISDALRWVLGEQSSRQLRGSKMQDVIFAGTATRKPKGMAEVTLVIDNSTGILPLEYTEVAVTRRMFRSGESEYMINGNQCRLRDIRELFMDTGIGVEGYSIIGQGKIADIVSTKPENRRQIFEEAAGVVLYKSRKAEAENKLKNASDNLERVRDIISEIEVRIGGLKEDSEKATEYLGLRDRYKELSINLILHSLENLLNSVESGKSELAELEIMLSDAASRLEAIDESVEETRNRESELAITADSTNAELIRIIDELNTITSGGEINKERLAAIDRDLTRISEETAAAADKLTALREELSGMEAEDAELNEGMDQMRTELRQAVTEYNEHSSRSAHVSAEIEGLKDLMITLSNKNVSRKAEISTLTSYQQTLRERKSALEEESEGRGKAEAESKAELARLESLLEEKGTQLELEREKIFEIAGNIISVNKHIEDISSELDELAVNTNRAIARKNTIEEMEANYEGYNNTVRALMHKRFKGITGPVSDIIRVPEGYETAVETALGGALQYIVCETDEDAKAAVRWLKSSRSGRATFLPAESVTADRLPVSERVIKSAGYIGIAADMVDSEDRYSEIVDYLLCRVIIADNMDNAVRMAHMIGGGFRIVTLEGEVVSAAGAITGGRFANKTANLLDRKKEISELSALINRYGKQTEDLIRKKESEMQREDDLAGQRDRQRDKVTELEIEYNVIMTDRNHAAEMAESFQSADSRMTNEIDTIAQDIERAKSMIEGYREKIACAEQDHAEAEAHALELTAELEKLNPLIEADNEKIVALKVSIGEKESKVLSRNEMIERVRDDITELEAQLEEQTEAYAKLEETKTLLTSHGEDTEGKEEELRLHKEGLERKIEELAACREENRLKAEELTKEQRDVRNGIEETRDRKYRLEIRTAKNETLLDTQKDKLWDEFEVSYAEALDLRQPDFAVTAGSRELREIKLRLAELGDVNVSAIEEYENVSLRYSFMTNQEQDLTRAMTELREIISSMDKTIRTKFKENFDQVVINFEESFRELFGGGYAELRLEDENRPLESGIEITAQPPGKKLKNINLLSGGEKTLTAIALMFAVLKAKPTPFVILDEVEAALDEVNIENFSEYLKKFDDIQFALITHQKATMEHADVLYGVTMPEQGISRLLSLRLGDEFDMSEE